METSNISMDRKIATGKFNKEKEYWINKLSGEFQRACFPYDYSKTTAGEYHKDVQKFSIRGELMSRILELTGGTFPKIHMVMVAGAAALLSRYTGKEDIVLGTSIDKQETDGPLINSILPLRIGLPVDMTFKDLLLDTRGVINEALENQNFPIETLIPEIVRLPVGSTNREPGFPLFDVVVLLENLQDKNYIQHLHTGIIFNFKWTSDEIEGQLEYESSYYLEDSIKRFIVHFLRLMHIVLYDIDIKIKDIPLLSEPEKNELTAFKNTGGRYPHGKTIYELFSLQVEKRPGEIAIIENNDTSFLTYRQLNQRAGGLAEFLVNQGVKTPGIIGILMERSIEQVVAILAVLKSGCAFLPLDIDYPRERKLYMLNDCSVELLLTRKSLVENLNWPGKIVCVEDIDTGADKTESPRLAFSRIQPPGLAYVIYTSGSTGKPKGVAVAHRALVNYIWWAAKTYINHEPTRFPFFTSAAFDLTLTSIFTPLVTGNTIVVYRGEDREFLVQKIFYEDKVETMKLTPVHLMLMSNCEGNPSKIKSFIVGGDRLETRLAKKINDNFKGNIEIYNEYGPTEATVGCMIYKFDSHNQSTISVPIGSPIDNLQIYLLDKHLEHVFKGGIGELYIVGEGLAMGYLNKPELTAEKFIPNPFAPGKKMFKTGDMARRLADGNLEFLGRTDQQVKIRGYRIETGEVEAALSKYERIQQVVVRAKEDEDGYNHLVAYVVPAKRKSQTNLGESNTPPGIEPGELRDYLSRHLPEFMIPSHFVCLEFLPVTINGKIDRRLLPESALKSMSHSSKYKAPQNEVEQVMVKVWQEIFKVESVSITDDYFSLGGDSIKAILLSSRLLDFNLKAATVDFFAHPTIEQLARVVKKTNRTIDQGLVEGVVELTPIQHWFFHHFYDLENPHVINHFNLSLMLYKKDGFDEHIIRKVLGKIAEHHDALRTVYEIESNQVTQRNRGMEKPPFHLHIFHFEDKENIETEITKQANCLQRGIDLQKGPLLITGLFKTASGDHLLIIVHHLIIDGVSWRILLEDFASGYLQAENNEDIKFPNKTDSFLDWAHRLKEYATSSSILNELAYWRKIEEIEIPPLPLEFAHGQNGPDSTNATKSTPHPEEKNECRYLEYILINLDKTETAALLRKVNRAYNTEVNDLLLAALYLSIRQWAMIEKVIVNLEGHGRENILEGINVNRTVGWYTTQYPVLLHIDMPRTNTIDHNHPVEDEHISQCIKMVKDTLRRIPNKGIGYGILKYLTPAEKKDNLLLNLEPEIGFNYLGQFDQTGTHEYRPSLFELSPISRGDNINPGFRSPYKLEINGSVINEVLNLSFIYNKYRFEKSSIKELAGHYKENLVKIIEHCLKKEESEVTLSDFTSSYLDMEDVTAIMDELSGEFNQ